MKQVNIGLTSNSYQFNAPLCIVNNKYVFGDACYSLHDYLYSRIQESHKLVNKIESLITRAINYGMFEGSIKVPNSLGGDTYYFKVV